MTSKNYRAPLLDYIKLCASSYTPRWIQTGVTVIRVKIGDLLSRVTLKFDGWPWKTIGQLFFVASSFMHHFIVIGEFKLKVQSGNAKFGSKSAIFLAVWPCNLTDDLQKQKGSSPKQNQALCIISAPYVNSNWSYGPETAKWGHNLWTLTLCVGITSAIGNHSWKFHVDTMRGTLWKKVSQTDGQTDRRK